MKKISLFQSKFLGKLWANANSRGYGVVLNQTVESVMFLANKKNYINPFWSNIPILYPFKTSENPLNCQIHANNLSAVADLSTGGKKETQAQVFSC